MKGGFQSKNGALHWSSFPPSDKQCMMGVWFWLTALVILKSKLRLCISQWVFQSQRADTCLSCFLWFGTQQICYLYDVRRRSRFWYEALWVGNTSSGLATSNLCFIIWQIKQSSLTVQRLLSISWNDRPRWQSVSVLRPVCSPNDVSELNFTFSHIHSFSLLSKAGDIFLCQPVDHLAASEIPDVQVGAVLLWHSGFS